MRGNVGSALITWKAQGTLFFPCVNAQELLNIFTLTAWETGLKKISKEINQPIAYFIPIMIQMFVSFVNSRCSMNLSMKANFTNFMNSSRHKPPTQSLKTMNLTAKAKKPKFLFTQYHSLRTPNWQLDAITTLKLSWGTLV